MAADLLTLHLPPARPADHVHGAFELRGLDCGTADDLARCYLVGCPPGVAASDLAGAIMVVTHSIWDADLAGPFIIDLFTDPAARGKGVGRALVQHAVDACSAAGDSALSLRFGEETSEAAMGTYRRLGFRPVE